mmetsp:Transcript_33216/g.83734  ORF Transcript_33216/g.83734 Transcript_33216/m.83734 type:complete len:88 (-) Transcript_33216:809-1072(-)
MQTGRRLLVKEHMEQTRPAGARQNKRITVTHDRPGGEGSDSRRYNGIAVSQKQNHLMREIVQIQVGFMRDWPAPPTGEGAEAQDADM